MAFTAAQLQVQLDALIKARNTGVLQVRHGDSFTQFRSLVEMNQTINDIKRQIDGLNSVKRSRVNYIEQRTKGFEHRFDIGRFFTEEK